MPRTIVNNSLAYNNFAIDTFVLYTFADNTFARYIPKIRSPFNILYCLHWIPNMNHLLLNLYYKYQFNHVSRWALSCHNFVHSFYPKKSNNTKICWYHICIMNTPVETKTIELLQSFRTDLNFTRFVVIYITDNYLKLLYYIFVYILPLYRCFGWMTSSIDKLGNIKRISGFAFIYLLRVICRQ